MNGIYNANVSASNFQFLFNLGLRMNLAKNKKKDSDHAATEHGVELGVKIPTINTRIIILSWALNSNTEGSCSVYLNHVFAY
ncbi:outer membrane beta-barrel protein [Helicobacter pylori]|uniref:outer membrane beta-barrel protein n=1 Tax=Helicobacter pylori TaxID=210 RepID=UPI001F0BF366|nr:outer membrane beta-barrel protein [Helicobacter pylori]